jgi:hypothetical protein
MVARAEHHPLAAVHAPTDLPSVVPGPVSSVQRRSPLLAPLVAAEPIVRVQRLPSRAGGEPSDPTRFRPPSTIEPAVESGVLSSRADAADTPSAAVAVAKRALSAAAVAPSLRRHAVTSSEASTPEVGVPAAVRGVAPVARAQAAAAATGPEPERFAPGHLAPEPVDVARLATTRTEHAVQRAEAEGAPAAGAAPAAGGESPEALDELAGKLYDRIRARLRDELLIDRERAGLLTDVR